MAAPVFHPRNMVYKNLGSTGLKVSAFSLGGWLTYGGTVNGDPVKAIMKLAFESGVNTFDSAEIYADGKCEIEMGRVIKELNWNRREIVVITKLFFGTGRKDPNQNGLSRKHLIEGMQDSLARLQLDYVDVVFAHRHDAATPMEEIVRGFNYLIEKGYAFYWGTSEWSTAQIEEAIGVANRLGLIGPVCEQPQYSMLERKKIEDDFLGLFAKYSMGTTIWSPLASGVLTGKYNDGVPAGSRFDTSSAFFGDTVSKLSTPEGKAKIAKVKALAEIAASLGCSQTALALAWCAVNPNVSTVILGATKPEQLVENLKALEVMPLMTPEVMQRIDDVLQNKPKLATTYGRARS